jgi:hypothetical protein
MRTLLDGQVRVRVLGGDVPVLDLTECVNKQGGPFSWLFG